MTESKRPMPESEEHRKHPRKPSDKNDAHLRRCNEDLREEIKRLKKALREQKVENEKALEVGRIALQTRVDEQIVLNDSIKRATDEYNDKIEEVEKRLQEIDKENKRQVVRARLLERHPNLGTFLHHFDAELLCIRVNAFLLLDGLTNAHYEKVT